MSDTDTIVEQASQVEVPKKEEPKIVKKTKKPSPWITHVKEFAKKNKISYKMALRKASASYKKKKKKSKSKKK